MKILLQPNSFFKIDEMIRSLVLFIFLNISKNETLFAQDYIPFLTKNGQYQFIDKFNGNFNPNKKTFNYLVDLNNNFYAFYDVINEKKTKLGLIYNGLQITDKKYDFISKSSQEIVIAITQDDFIELIDKYGNIISTNQKIGHQSINKNYPIYSFNAGLFLFIKSNDTLTALDKNGKVAFNLGNVDLFYPFNGNYASIHLKNKPGFYLIDKKGITSTLYTYDEISYLKPNLFYFKKNGKLGILNNNLVEVKYGIYESIENMGESWSVNQWENNNFSIFNNPIELIKVKRNGLYTFLNDQLEEILKPSFLEASEFKNGSALVKLKSNYCFIDTLGYIRKSCGLNFDFNLYQNYGLSVLRNQIYSIYSVNDNCQSSYPLDFPFFRNYIFSWTGALSHLKLPFIFLPTKIDTSLHGYYLENIKTENFPRFFYEEMGGGAAATYLVLFFQHKLIDCNYPTSAYNNCIYDYFEFNDAYFQKAISLPYDKWFLIDKKGMQYRDSSLYSRETTTNIIIKAELKKNTYPKAPPTPPMPLNYIRSESNIKEYNRLITIYNKIKHVEEIDSFISTIRLINNIPDNQKCKTVIKLLFEKMNKILDFIEYNIDKNSKEREFGDNFPKNILEQLNHKWMGLDENLQDLYTMNKIYEFCMFSTDKIPRILKEMYPEYILK